MNVAMVSMQSSPLPADAGEQSAHIAELSAALARQGHRVMVYTRRDDPDQPECVETPQGYNVIHVPAGPPRPLDDDELLAAMGPFAQYLAEHWATSGHDIAHAHFWTSGIATELAAQRLRLPTVLRFHGLGTEEPRRRFEAKLARTATEVSANCTAEAFKLIRMGRPREGTAMVPSGVDVNVCTPGGPLAPRSDAPRVLSVGELVPDNGFDTVIKALPYIPGAEFVIIGEADAGQSDAEACRLRDLAARLGVADRLRLHGAATAAELPALLRSADVVACTPRHDSSGVVALKAMACGVPVVASAVGASPDIVVDDVTGYLVAHQDPRRFAGLMNMLLVNSFLRRSLGAAGRDRTVARYSWERIASDTARLYQASISKGGHKPKAATG
ncbi:glycosyltransferase [Mycobacterium sp. JS623]|uniref:glycosyltransferase n=1 Tax=Mycobacterium sp. JS623 TaxID=212767 RepID=UPI0002A5A6BB|nr:glycosyltransferase [Mycobacterium sp. JS623]AGB21734.1 glycosyltransferase [Mycobacterium sp. JS623]